MPNDTGTLWFFGTAGSSLRQCAFESAIGIARHRQTNRPDGFQDGAGVQSFRLDVDALSALRALRVFADSVFRAMRTTKAESHDVTAGEGHFVFLWLRLVHGVESSGLRPGVNIFFNFILGGGGFTGACANETGRKIRATQFPRILCAAFRLPKTNSTSLAGMAARRCAQ